MSEKYLTARQLAERYGVAASTARGWFLRKLLPGAELRPTGLGDNYWVVPESSLKNFTPPKPGPAPRAQKPPAKPARKRSRKSAAAE